MNRRSSHCRLLLWGGRQRVLVPHQRQKLLLFLISWLDRFNHGDHLSSIPTTFEKLEELYHLEKNLWFHSLDLPLKSPEMLDFSKFITRTKLLDWSWELPSNHQSALGNRLAHQLSEQLLYLYRNPVNIYDQRPKSFNARKMRRIMLISSCMETAYQTIMSTQPASPFARGIHQIDEFARVETFLKRLYPREMWSSVSEVDEDLFDDVDETVLDDEGCVRYRIRADLAWQLRGPDPLQPVSRNYKLLADVECRFYHCS